MWKPEQLSSDPAAENLPEPNSSKEDGTGLPPRKPGSKGYGRKRTKSGCLTCRKRRIKCGEERPTCQNCIKSKRQCDGYNQRVIFKDPLNTYRPPISTSSKAPISFIAPIVGQPPVRQGKPKSQAILGQDSKSIAPKLQFTSHNSHRDFEPASTSSLPFIPPVARPKWYTFLASSHDGQFNNQESPSKYEPSYNVESDIIDQPRLPEPRQFHAPKEQAIHYDFNALVKTESGNQAPYPHAPINPLNWTAGPSPTYYQSYHATTAWIPANTPVPTEDVPAPCHQRELGSILGVVDTFEETRTHQIRRLQGTSSSIVAYTPRGANLNTTLPSPSIGSQHFTPKAEKEYYFPGSDDDAAMEEYNAESWHDDMQDDHLKSNDLGIIVAFQAHQDQQGLNLHSVPSFIDQPNILSTYVPSSQATPMQDPVTAMIFCHFVNVTGPSMSIFERHPANPSLMFEGAPVPRSQQHIWAYTFPTLGLQNHALLHAMLALASFHSAKLHGGSITASLKHYAIGLRRVANSVSLPTRRSQPATLAAAMLLAFYEVWSADHQKWSNHLLGAKQLIREIDFISVARYVRRKKAQQRQEERERQNRVQSKLATSASSYNNNYPGHDAEEADDNFVNLLMGSNVNYVQHGQRIDIASDSNWNKEYTEKDLETYETQRDLFWWYCKQDVSNDFPNWSAPQPLSHTHTWIWEVLAQGTASQNMEYSYWSHCPPRAPLGRLNAVYGSFDHLILLMGRLANFAAKDLKRKRLAMKVNGGWRPPPWMFPQGQTSAVAPSPRTSTVMPPFSGMVPGVKDAQLPMGFDYTPNISPQSMQSEEYDLQARTQEAEEEWQDIRTVFTMLEDHFGEDFQPLGQEFSAPFETPFGTALQYRTYGIAGLWMNYYMGLISCYRSHPSMPPASMVAAGVTRKKTEFFANQLGRIAAGIAPDCHISTHVSPSSGAVLIESSTCLFVSAIQYQDATQRHWTIRRLHHIVRLTGWQTALAIASGCEASWSKTFEAGKGPAYTRAPDVVADFFPNGPDEKGMSNQDMHPLKRRIDRAFVGKSVEERRAELGKPDRVHYALGVLGLEEDFAGLDVGDG